MCASESRAIAELTSMVERLQAKDASLRAEIAELQQRIVELEAKLARECF